MGFRLMDKVPIMLRIIGTSGRHSSRSEFGQSFGNDVGSSLGHYVIICPLVYFPIEGVLGSKQFLSDY